MKKFYLSALAFAAAMTMAPAQAWAQDAAEEQPVSVEELNGRWLFKGVPSDWHDFGVKLPTAYDVTLNTVAGSTTVTMEGLFATCYDYDDESGETPIACTGVWDPEEQTITFTDIDQNYWFADEYYEYYIYYVKFKAHKVDGNIWLTLVPTTHEVLDDDGQPTGETEDDMCIINIFDPGNDYAYDYYGYDNGGTLTRYAAGTNTPGQYSFVYTDDEGKTQVKLFNLEADGSNYKFVGDDVTMPATVKSYRTGRNTTVTGLTLNYVYDEATELTICSNFWGIYDVECYFDGEGGYFTNVDLYYNIPEKEELVMHDLRIVPGVYEVPEEPDPVDPTDPDVDPTDPTDPGEGGEVDPVDPVDPDPVDPVDPDPVDPVDPDPVDPVDPDPVDPVDPDPVDPVDPDPVDPVDPDPVDPVDPDPVDPVDPDPVDPVDPDPVDPDPVDPVNPDEGIDSIYADSNNVRIFNLAGQRMENGLGIRIEDGRKVMR